MWWYQSSKTAKIFCVTLDVAMHRTAYGRYCKEVAYGLSNGHVTGDVKLVSPIRLERNISKTAGFRDSVPKDRQ